MPICVKALSDATQKVLKVAFNRPLEDLPGLLSSANPVFEDQNELQFWLLDGIVSPWDDPLARWRNKVLNRALTFDPQAVQASQDPWQKKYPSLGGPFWNSTEVFWPAVPGLRRLCLVQPLLLKPRGEENQPSGFNIITKSESNDFLPFIKKSIDKMTYSKNVTFIEIKINESIGFRVWSSSTLDDHNSTIKNFENYLDLPAADTTKLFQGCYTIKEFREPFFFFVLDTPQKNYQACDEETLQQLYASFVQKLLGRNPVATSKTQLTHLPCEMEIDAGVVGLEGMIVVRTISENHAGSDLLLGGDDLFWGGSAWLAWLITLFQRAETVSHADDAMTLAETISKERPPKDLVKEARDFLKDVVCLEATWMYREVSKRTDIDRFYRELQMVYDLDETWEDVRAQTQLISEYIEIEADKEFQENWRKLNYKQTLAGMVAGAALFITGYFGMNLEGVGVNGNSLFDVSPRLIISAVLLITCFSIVWYRKGLDALENTGKKARNGSGLDALENNRKKIREAPLIKWLRKWLFVVFLAFLLLFFLTFPCFVPKDFLLEGFACFWCK